MQRPTKAIVATATLAGSIVAGTGVALAAHAGSDTETPITGPALERASVVALERTGRGRVTATEVGDEESLYEIEVTSPDGSAVDVQLDVRFDIVGVENDGTPDGHD